MTGKRTAECKSQQPGRVFVDSNGRTYPTAKSSCVGASTCTTPRKATLRSDITLFTTDISSGNNHKRQSLGPPPPPLPTTTQHIKEYALDSRRRGNRCGIMDCDQVQAEHAQPSVESSKVAELRMKSGRRPSVVAEQSPAVATESPTAVKRADSKISNSSQPSSLMANENDSSLDGLATVHNDVASMHSNQSFDLGYKSRPAQPYVSKSHMRVWNSAYTRPLEDMLREILEVRYPLRAEGEIDDERSPLLGFGLSRSNYGWLCGLGSLWCPRARLDDEEEEEEA